MVGGAAASRPRAQDLQRTGWRFRTMTDSPGPGSTLEGWLARVDDVFEVVEALPRRLRWIAFRLRNVFGRLDQRHFWDIARTVGKDRARYHAHNHLRADSLREQRVVAAHVRGTVDAQLRRATMHADE